MKFAYCYAGGNTPAIKEFDIEPAAKTEVGQVVCAIDGVITEDVKGAKVIGVCEETHTGKEDMLNVRSNGNKLRVNVTDGVYETEAIKLVAAETGTETAFVCDSTGLSDNLSGAMLVLVRKGEGSTNTDEIGKIREIVSCSITDNEIAEITLNEAGVVCKGDVYAIFPMLATELVLDKDKTGYAFANSDTDVTLRCVGFDVDRKKVYVKLTNTIFA